MVAQEHGAIARSVARVERAEELPDDLDPVDPVRERPTDELLLERRMPAGTDPDVQMLPGVRERRDDFDPRHAPQLGDDLGVPRLGEVALARAEPFEYLRRSRSSTTLLKLDHDAVQMREVRPPVVAVPDQRQLLAAVPVLDEEGAAPDRPARLRVHHAIAPDGFEVLAAEHVRREHGPEETSPARDPGTKDDPEGLRVDLADRLHRAVVCGTGVIRGEQLQDRGVGEDEVPSGDGDTVAPAGFGTNAVGEREGRLFV